MSDLPRAMNESGRFVPLGRTWNRLVDLVSRLTRITAAKPLSLKNTSGGIVIALEHPLYVIYTVVIDEPVQDQTGRYLGTVISDQASSNASNDLTIGELGPATQQTVEVWNLAEVNGGPAMVAGDVVKGFLHGQSTGEDGSGFPIAYAQPNAPERIIPVYLSNGTGSGGSDGVLPAFTYSILKATGPFGDADLIASGVEVVDRRSPIAHTKADDGAMALAGQFNGVWKLFGPAETLQITQCDIDEDGGEDT